MGLWEEDKRDVEREIANFYHKLYSNDARFRPKLEGISFYSLPRDRALSLRVPFSLEEIKVVVDGMSGDRAPGPNGFPIALFFLYSFGMILRMILNSFFKNFS